MSVGRLALEELGIPVEKYYASEIDKFAIKVSQANFPDTVQVGDVKDLWPGDYKNIDLVLCGSPCQGFSVAGKKLAFDDPRSALFFEFIRILKEVKPKYFLLENVRMKQEWLDIITGYVSDCYPDYKGGNDMFSNRIEPIMINSSLVSAQSRKRYYWTNIPNVSIPEDRNLFLSDVLEDGFVNERDKSHCITATYYKGANIKDYLTKSRRQLVNKPKGMVGGALRSRSFNKDGKHVGWKTTKPRQTLELRKDNKSNAISTAQKDSVVVDDNLAWRMLKPIEVERLQTVPDNYTNHVSNTQRYKMLGNSFTNEVIKHILKNLI